MKTVRCDIRHQRVLSYQADGISEGDDARKWCQNRHGSLDPFHGLITRLGITDGLCLALEKGSNVLDCVTTLEFHRERVFGQCDPRLFLICLQGRLEKHLKACGSCQ